MDDDIITLLDNPEFRLWVLFPDAARNEFWNKVAIDFPEKRVAIEKARLIYIRLSEEFEVEFPEPHTVNIMLGKILLSK